MENLMVRRNCALQIIPAVQYDILVITRVQGEAEDEC